MIMKKIQSRWKMQSHQTNENSITYKGPEEIEIPADKTLQKESKM